MSGVSIFVPEALGTALLVLLGNGVVANHVLRNSLGHGTGTLFITIGWAFAVFVGASVAAPSGAYINPAVTIGTAIAGSTPWSEVPIYLLAQLAGAIVGAVACWAAYKLQFDDHDDPAGTLGIFATVPPLRHNVWNLVTEVIGTFVLLIWILTSATDETNKALGYAGVSFVVLVIGTSLGGPTGYAINPARDLGPRIAYAFLLPIRGKGSPQWSYAWIPVVGPLLGATLAALVFLALPT